MISQLSVQFDPVPPLQAENIKKLTVEQRAYLAGPIIHTPGGWSVDLPKMYFGAIHAERLALLVNPNTELEATELECMIYMYGHVMSGPPTGDYFKIYMYLSKRVCERIQKRPWPMKESEDHLSDWNMNLLKKLASDIRRGVVKNCNLK